MGGKGDLFLRKAILLGFITLIAVMGLVLAEHIVRTSTIGIDFGSVNEDLTNLYNFSVNNTDTVVTANITEVNITLPAGFAFDIKVDGNGTNGTSAGSHIFSNTTTILTWKNASTSLSLIVNQTTHYFSFNATASIPGTYNFTVQTRNASGALTSSSLNVTINDTTIPSDLSFASRSAAARANLSATGMFFNVTVTDNGLPQSVRFLFYNASGAQFYNSTNVTISVNSSWVNFTGLTDGTFVVYALANDTKGNLNTTGANRTVTLDTSSPIVTLTRSSSSTKYKLVIDIALSDGTSGISGTCSDNKQGGTVSGTGTSQTFTEENLECGHSYEIEITCNDYASNSGSSTKTFLTDSCGGGGSTGGTGGGGTGGWTNTFVYDSQDFSQIGSVTKDLEEDKRIKIKIDGQIHYVGVIALTSTSATIQVTSDPQEATLNPGQSKKFEVTGDNYYDMKVTLTSISGNTASVTTEYVHEQVPQPSLPTDTGAETGEALPEEAGKRFAWLWIAIIIIVLVVVGVIYYNKKKANN